MTMTKLPNGVAFRDEVVGTGIIAGKGSSFIKIHYTGYLKNPDGTPGKVFDCSRTRNQPFTFPIGVEYVISGWDHGIKGRNPQEAMKVGGRRIIHVPAELGFGAKGFGKLVPPNADLIFDIELLQA